MKPGLFLGLLLALSVFFGLLLGLGLQAAQDSFFVLLVLNGLDAFTIRAWAKAHSRKYQYLITPVWLWLLTFMSGFAVPIYLFKVHGFWRGCWANVKALMFVVLMAIAMFVGAGSILVEGGGF